MPTPLFDKKHRFAGSIGDGANKKSIPTPQPTTPRFVQPTSKPDLGLMARRRRAALIHEACETLGWTRSQFDTQMQAWADNPDSYTVGHLPDPRFVCIPESLGLPSTPGTRKAALKLGYEMYRRHQATGSSPWGDYGAAPRRGPTSPS